MLSFNTHEESIQVLVSFKGRVISFFSSENVKHIRISSLNAEPAIVGACMNGNLRIEIVIKVMSAIEFKSSVFEL